MKGYQSENFHWRIGKDFREELTFVDQGLTLYIVYSHCEGLKDQAIPYSRFTNGEAQVAKRNQQWE